MKIIHKKDRYKIFNTSQGKTYYVGKIPLHWLMYYLSRWRDYNKELAINYIKEIYEIDISEVIDDDPNWEWNNANNYEEFEKKYPRKDYDPYSREYFKNKGRQYYLNFVDWIGHLPEKDFINTTFKSEEVHHIFPLVYGGDNSLQNLIHISNFHHNILHENPLEHIKKYCFQAVDYLWYIQYPFADGYKNWINKYEFNKYINKGSILTDLYKLAIKEEMLEFYDWIQEQENKMNDVNWL